MSKLSDRIATTATVLDRLYPSWYKRIDLATLNMCDGSSCVAGQLAKSYRHVNTSRPWQSAYSVFTERFVRKARKSDRVLLGIDPLAPDAADDALALGFGVTGKTAWTREIRARRALDAARNAS